MRGATARCASYALPSVALTQASGTRFVLGHEALSLRAAPPCAAPGVPPSQLQLSSGEALAVDAVVVAAGVGSGRVLQALGGDAMPPTPLYGMRGHRCPHVSKFWQRGTGGRAA